MAKEPERLLRIGEAAGRVGLSLRTLRFWEEEGIVRPTARSQGGFRLYSEADIERLRFVKLMKPLKLSLDEMRELLSLIETAGGPAGPEAVVGERLVEYAERARERILRIERDLEEANALLGVVEARAAPAVR